jgi:uncharacterized protein (DUF885 family)
MKLTIAAVLLAVLAIPAAAQEAQGLSESETLRLLLEEEWEFRLRENPGFATYIGDRRYDDRWTDLSEAAIERRREAQRGFLARIRAIDPSQLSADERLNHQLMLRDLETEVAGFRFPSELIPIHQMGGVHQVLPELGLLAPPRTTADYRNFIARLRAYPALVDQTIALMRRGLAQGVMPPRVPLRGVATAIEAQLGEKAEETPVWNIAFAEMPESIPEAEKTKLRAGAREAIESSVLPALRKLAAFWNDEYYPKTRTSIALTELPSGADWYAHNVREQTTTELTPGEIHEIGLSEVKRIRAGMDAIRKEVGFEGDLEAFFTFMRRDPRFFFTTKEELIVAYRDIAKRIDPELPRLFGTLPRMPYGVIPVPEYSEQTQTTAYYMPGSPAAGRAGYFYANTYDLPSRPKWEMEALTVHEAVPGHHLQISLAQELEAPPFRQWGGYTAYVEGWGLYSESLGPELGLYADPYSRFGQLTYEMWRAVRLVVDTGMHAKGWTRDQAIEYFRKNAGKAEHDIAVEIDRYIVWPGQALAYKIGQLKIQELRSLAERELGERFDIRRFHDTVLLAGPLPLSILETRVREWIEAEGASGGGF